MKHDFRAEFVSKVRAAHNLTTCHWTAAPDIFDPTHTPVIGLSGPCKCPSQVPCNHGCRNCANTEEVLRQQLTTHRECASTLKTLGDKVDQIEEAAQVGDQIADLEKDATGNSRPFDAWDSTHIDVLASVMHSRFGFDKADIASLLQPLPNCTPSTDRLDGTLYCRCTCIQNKLLRLNAEKQYLHSLQKDIAAANAELDKLFNELSTSHWGVLGGHIFNALGSLLEEDYQLFLESAVAMLRINTTEYNKDGIAIYMLYKGLLSLTHSKAAYLNGVLLHDQELQAPTCMPLPQDTPQPAGPPPGRPPIDVPTPQNGGETGSEPWHECGERFVIAVKADGKTPVDADQNAENEEKQQKEKACPKNCPAARISRSSRVEGEPPNCTCYSVAVYVCGSAGEPEPLRKCDAKFTIEKQGEGVDSTAAQADAQDKADKVAKGQCPSRCPFVRIAWVSQFRRGKKGQTICEGKGTYVCRTRR